MQLARLLAQDAEVLILDEPVNNLDPKAASEFYDLVGHLHHRRGLTVLTVTHEIQALPRACDRLAFLKGGHLLASGTKEELLKPAMLSEVYGFPMRVDTGNAPHRVWGP